MSAHPSAPLRLVLLTIIGIALAPPTGAANLGEIHALARAHDARYAAAREAWRAGQEKLPQGRAGLLPSLSLSANLRRNDTSNADYTSRSYGLSLSQPIYRRQNLESWEQAKLLVLRAEQELAVAEQDLMLRVARAYFDVLLAEDTLRTVRAQKQAIAEQLAAARMSFDVGTATITDTHEAQARFDLVTAQEIAALNDLDVARRALEKLINREAPALARLDEQARLPLPQPNDMEVWVSQAERDGLAVALQRTALEIAQREVARQRGGHHPTLDLAASYSDNRNVAIGGGGVTGNTRSGMVGIEFALPLYQGGATQSRVRESLALRDKAQFDLDEARRQARLDARQAFLGVLSGDARVRALEQALVSSQAQLRSTTLGLEVGVRTRVDVLNAQQQLFTTRRDLAAARYQTLISGLQLKAAAGSLTVEDLHAVDALLRESAG